jgi:DNA ligase-1
MRNVISIFEQINNTSSRNEKESILQQNKNNRLLKEVLEFTYNPYKIFGIGKKTFNSKIQGETEFLNIIDLLGYLLEHNTGTDFDKNKVNKFINNQPKEDQIWYQKIILKDLSIGITEKTINKVFPSLVPVFDCMLASPFEERKFHNIIVEPKLDGIRAVYLNGNLFTRNGKILEGFNEIQDQLNRFPKDFVFDGELMGRDFTSTQELTFKKSNNKTGVNYNIFDCLPVNEFQQGKSKQILIDRKETLKEIYINIGNNNYTGNLKLVQSSYVGKYNMDIINDIHYQIVQQGFEGSMLKSADSIYEAKRTKTWLKLKNFDLLDLKVVDIFEGEDKYSGMLGGVVVDYKGYSVKVGSGFNEEDRTKFWNSPELILGKVIMVQTQQESKDKFGNLSLRFPTFKGVRIDK